MSVYMGTTRISPEKTTGQIQAYLAGYGVKRVQTTYEANEIVGLDFSVELEGKEVLFSLPVRWQPVYELKGIRTEDQARRTAWRIVYRWIQAQLALVDVGMVEMQEVFLPYLLTPKGTLYEQIAGNGFLQIER